MDIVKGMSRELYTSILYMVQVTFHPHLENFMASGSTDGLLSVFDIAQTSEDDALLSTFNTEATVVSRKHGVKSIMNSFLVRLTVLNIQIILEFILMALLLTMISSCVCCSFYVSYVLC